MFNLHRKPASPLTRTPTIADVRLLGSLVAAVEDVRSACDHRAGHDRVAFLVGQLHDARRSAARAGFELSMIDSIIVSAFAADLPDSIPTPFDCDAACRALQEEPHDD